jgi:F-type H+-transporting ATPase subunit gamma
MPNLKEVKNRIQSVVSTQQITKAMKMVAAAKLRKSQDRIIQMRPFAKKLNDILQNLSTAESSGNANWYSDVREEKKILIVAISADRGLCGSFNSNVFKGVLNLVNGKYKQQFSRGDVSVLTIGKKANDYFTKRKFSLLWQYANLFQGLSYGQVSEVGDFLIE